MRRRYPIPTVWLFTDERIGDALWPALRALPFGAGVVVRHYSLPLGKRRALWRRIRAMARGRCLVLVRAGEQVLGGSEAGQHGPGPRRRAGLRTMSVHDARESARTRRLGADAVFISPVFPTRSHPGAPALGARAASHLARVAGRPAIALGGINARRAQQIRRLGFAGWAAIDAWIQR